MQSTTTSIPRIPVIFKDLVGKPRRGGEGLSFNGHEKVEWVSLRQIADRTWGMGVKGKLFINGNYDIERWLREGRDKDKTPRKRAYFLGSALMTIDIDEGLPAGTVEETIDFLIEKSDVIRDYAGALFPSSSYTEAKPKMHILFALDGLITDWDEYKELHGRLRRAIQVESDDAMQTPVQPLYGTQRKDGSVESVMGHEWDHVLPLAYLRGLPALPAPLTKHKRVRAERQGVRRMENAKRGQREVKSTLQLVRFILDCYVAAGQAMPYSEWIRFRLAAQDASGKDMAVFEEMTKHPYWKHDEWDVETERYLWEADEPHTVNIGTLYAMAYELGWGQVNHADLIPDHKIASLDELPALESYLLKADTGVGKSQAQKATIAAVREAGKKICWIVPTKTLSLAAANDFCELGATAYLDGEGEIKASEDLREAEFIVTTPQTFARRIAPYGLRRYGLLVLDEVQQIGNAAFEDNNALWRDIEVLKAFHKGIEEAKATDGLILRGLDAGMSRMAQKWLGLPTYECTHHLDKAPVKVFESEAALTRALSQALRLPGKLTYITCDTKSKSFEIAEAIKVASPRKRVLLVNADTLDTRTDTMHERAIAFMKDPNRHVGDYDVIVVTPSMLTGVSIVEREADHVFQFCSYLLPKHNLQMLNRFRRQGQVYVAYSGVGAAGDAKTAEEAVERAEILARGMPLVARSEMAKRANELREIVELDALYQSFDPQTYYVKLLEGEGREVEYQRDIDIKPVRSAKKEKDNAALEWALDHYHEDDIEEYNPLRRYRGVSKEEFEAMLLKRKVNNRTLGGWEFSDNKRQTAEDVDQFESRVLTLVERKTGSGEQNTVADQTLLDEDVSVSRVSPDDKILILLHGLRIIGYEGETVIPAHTFKEHGSEMVKFLSNNAEYWNAIFPKTKRLNISGDDIADARGFTKDLLSLIGLRMRRGSRTRIVHNGKRLFNAEVENVEALKRVLYLRACGRAHKAEQDLPDGIEFVFRELSAEATGEATIEAMNWLAEQPKATMLRVKEEIRYLPDFVKCVNMIRQNEFMPF